MGKKPKLNAEQKARLLVDAAKAAALTVDLLIQAYKKGEESDHVDWEDVDQAHIQALHARALADRAGS